MNTNRIHCSLQAVSKGIRRVQNSIFIGPANCPEICTSFHPMLWRLSFWSLTAEFKHQCFNCSYSSLCVSLLHWKSNFTACLLLSDICIYLFITLWILQNCCLNNPKSMNRWIDVPSWSTGSMGHTNMEHIDNPKRAHVSWNVWPLQLTNWWTQPEPATDIQREFH